MSKSFVAACAGVLSAAYASSVFAFDALSGIPLAIASGKPDLDARLRYEGVYQSNIDAPADALTLRLRAGYTTGQWNALDAQFQLDAVSPMGRDNYNSTNNDRTQYPVVADPRGGTINQAWIGYDGLPDTVIRFGRQRIIFDNGRFVGNVGWRQHEQTYDGFTLAGTWLPMLTLNYAYLTNVNAGSYNNINGHNTRDIGLHGTHLLHLSYAPSKEFTASAYGYLLKFAYNAPLPPAAGAVLNVSRRDSATYGARAAGILPTSGITVSYAVDVARQRAFGKSPSSVAANYYLAESSVTYKIVNGGVGYEVLSGDGHYGFQTPLATLHIFQGWADQFLTTPATGIRDFYFDAGGTFEKFVLTAVWHDFSADNRSAARYGSELDLQATRPLAEGVLVGATYAKYNPDHYPAAQGLTYDTTKYWFWIEYRL